MKHLKVFETNALFEAARAALDLPNVSLIEENFGIQFLPYVPPYNGFCKLILNNGETVELEGSGELTNTMINSYNKEVCVSAEIGTLCTSIGSGSFHGCTNLTSIDIPSNVTSIGDGAFNQCSSLTSIEIPNSVTYIGTGAFATCTNLTSCTIGNGVITINHGAFNQCSSLTSCTIGSGVTSIGNDVFKGCSSLTSIVVHSTTPPTLGGDAFNNTNNCPIYVPSASIDAYKSAGSWYNYRDRIQAIP